LTGKATIVMAEGRRMMRLARELEPEQFRTLLEEYQQLLTGVFEERGGRGVDAAGDTVVASFPIAKDAAFAAVAAHRAVAARDWPGWPRPGISVGLDSAEERCSELCDAAEGGQTFMSQATAGQLEEDDLRDLSLRDVGEQQARRSGRPVRAYELVA
jgi:class 3 adenylate cyclase